MARAGVSGFNVNVECLGLNSKILTTAETIMTASRKRAATGRADGVSIPSLNSFAFFRCLSIGPNQRKPNP